MRTIKFRGKRYGDGDWVYGNLYQGTKEGEQYSIILDDAGYHIPPQDDRDLAIAFAENEVNVVLPGTVGQFTGLCDKNGKDIYEGDIVARECRYYGTRRLPSYSFLKFGEVRFQQCDCRFVMSFSDCELDLCNHYAADIEVAGNIYDNPELMKQNE